MSDRALIITLILCSLSAVILAASTLVSSLAVNGWLETLS